MNYKFVLENRHETPTAGRSVKLEAPPLRDTTPRKKQWTTRARTGCITCRYGTLELTLTSTLAVILHI